MRYIVFRINGHPHFIHDVQRERYICCSERNHWIQLRHLGSELLYEKVYTNLVIYFIYLQIFNDNSYFRYDDKYELVLTMYDPKNKKTTEGTFIKSVANFIDNDGFVTNQIVESEVMKLWDSVSLHKKDK